MISRFIDFIQQKRLFTDYEKILLAISGGIDSMVMLCLFEKAGFTFSAVHCNFQLRGAESDADELFVKKFCTDHGIQLFTSKFDTLDYSKLNGISVEMAARELRYKYFEQVRSEHKFDYIATAHHQDDLIETFFINLTRKSGIKGLSGMDEKAGNIIRPMLFTSRPEIEVWAKHNNLPFREDSSNRELIFQRNFIRHSLLPLFERLNPAARKNILHSIGNLKEAFQVYNASLLPRIKNVLKTEGKFEVVAISSLLQTEFPELILFEILSQFGFNAVVTKEIFSGIAAESGKQYFSQSHRVVKDRDRLIITLREKTQTGTFYVEEEDLELFSPFEISIESHRNKNFKIPSDPSIACLNRDLLEFPLLIRKWEPGDYFHPYGMKGVKKISDFLIDEKVPIPEKENTWILQSGQKVAWLIGRRIDNRFRITSETKNIYILKIK